MTTDQTDPDQVHFTLLENGLDFVWSAVEHLSVATSKRELKYALLHLVSGIELILKERLRREDWKPLFPAAECDQGFALHRPSSTAKSARVPSQLPSARCSRRRARIAIAILVNLSRNGLVPWMLSPVSPSCPRNLLSGIKNSSVSWSVPHLLQHTAARVKPSRTGGCAGS